MKQEYIARFILKTSGSFTTENTMRIQHQLQKTSDEAFPILMTHKVSANPIAKGALYLVAAFCTLIFVVGFCNIYYPLIFGGRSHEDFINLFMPLVFLMAGIATFIGAKCLKPSKQKMYEEFSKIILAYQGV